MIVGMDRPWLLLGELGASINVESSDWKVCGRTDGAFGAI